MREQAEGNRTRLKGDELQTHGKFRNRRRANVLAKGIVSKLSSRWKVNRF
jgi:hypothetical protein